MKRPTKKAFYEYMSERYDRKFKDNKAYDELLDIIVQASDSNSKMMELAELTLMSRADRLIYRNTKACEGIELTPTQVDEYLSTIEYALEHIDS